MPKLSSITDTMKEIRIGDTIVPVGAEVVLPTNILFNLVFEQLGPHGKIEVGVVGTYALYKHKYHFTFGDGGILYVWRT